MAGQAARLSKRWIIAFCQIEAAVKWSDAFVAGGAVTKRIGVWVKPDGMPQFSGDRPAMGYETLVFAHAKGRSKWNGGGRSSVFTFNKGEHERTGHQTQKPLPLMLELVSLFTDPDDLVLDPYAGSGTTGVACLRLGRRFIGCELDPAFATIARDRLAAEANGLSLGDARRGQTSMFTAEDLAPKLPPQPPPMVNVGPEEAAAYAAAAQDIQDRWEQRFQNIKDDFADEEETST